ncbi:hypothetical protein ACIA8K_06845 [Catenuloplanes sp. NPDC051500]|uniref:hypothetical protein n=1 Tax=Catenuloplanes sp. NPDC051500 TaxID=3363959 RepID=UPI0037A48600
MDFTNPIRAAEALEAVAADLRKLGDVSLPGLHVYLGVQVPVDVADEEARKADVDRVAGILGLPVEGPSKTHSLYCTPSDSEHVGGLPVDVYTGINRDGAA